jgi:hypothetical protein
VEDIIDLVSQSLHPLLELPNRTHYYIPQKTRSTAERGVSGGGWMGAIYRAVEAVPGEMEKDGVSGSCINGSLGVNNIEMNK